MLEGMSLKGEQSSRRAHRVGRASHDRLELFPQVVHGVKALANLDDILDIAVELVDARAAFGEVLSRCKRVSCARRDPERRVEGGER